MNRFKLLLSIIRSRINLLIGSLFLLLISVFIRTLEPKVIQVIIDFILKNNEIKTDFFNAWILDIIEKLTACSLTEKAIILAEIYVLLAAIRSVFMLSSRAISYNSAEKSIQEFRVNLFEHIQKLPLASFSKLNKGELIQRSTGDMDTIKNFISNNSIELIRLSALFVFATVMLFQINLSYAFWSSILSPIILISTYYFFKYEGEVWKKHEDEADKLTNIAQENLNGIRTVKAYDKMKDEIAKFEIQNQRKFKAGMGNIKLHTFFWPLTDFILYFQSLIFIVLGGIYVLKGEMTIGELVAAYTYMTMLGFPLRQAGRILSQMSMAFVAIDRIQDILSLDKENNKGKIVESLKGNIRFENVDFAYDPKSDLVLKNIRFEVNQGEKIAIMGSSASGKSTLMKLLLRLYEPSNGAIYVNNFPIKGYQLSSLRHRIGIVMQQSILFSMDVSGNLDYANANSSESMKHEMMNLAGFGNYNEILPKGMETEIGEKGVSLSGGQKQRLSLARTMIKENDILILDDITSALDKNTERVVLENVFESNQEKTVFIITHRISTMKQADKVLVLNSQGEIQNFGDPIELMKTDEFLKEMAEIEAEQIAEISF